MPNEVNWERHIPMYRNPDGTLWLRFFADNRKEIGHLNSRFFGHPKASQLTRAPLYVLYDPDPATISRRQVFGIGGNAWQALDPLIHIERGGAIRLFPTTPTRSRPVEEWANIGRFLRWGFPGPTVIATVASGHSTARTSRTVNMLLSMGSGNKPPVSTIGALINEDPGFPEFDIASYRMLGLTPLRMPDHEFGDWAAAQQR